MTETKPQPWECPRCHRYLAPHALFCCDCNTYFSDPQIISIGANTEPPAQHTLTQFRYFLRHVGERQERKVPVSCQITTIEHNPPVLDNQRAPLSLEWGSLTADGTYYWQPVYKHMRLPAGAVLGCTLKYPQNDDGIEVLVSASSY